MKRHAFDQQEIIGASNNNDKWVKFKKITDALGFTVRVTGGVYLTHELSGTKKDFEIVLELVNDYRITV
jgi:hypothetical protein